MSFKNDLIQGEIAEIKLLRYLKKIDKKAFKVSGKFSDYDISLPTINKTIEVKRDFKSTETNNFAIEFKCYDKLSGISTTKSDVFVIIDDLSYYFFNTNKLKDFLRNNWSLFKKVKGGDYNASEMILVKKNVLIKNVKCKILPVDNFCF